MRRQVRSGLPPQTDIGQQEEGAGRFQESKLHNNKRRILGPEWSLSDVGKPPSHDSYIPHGLVTINTHTHTHTYTPRCKCGLRSAKGWWLCESGVSSQYERSAAISDQSRDSRAMAGGVSRHSTAAGSSGGQKRKGKTPTGEFSMDYTVSRPSRRVQELVERCCILTRHSTCSTTGPSNHACKFRNSGWQ